MVLLEPNCLAKAQTVILTDSEPVTAMSRSDSAALDSLRTFKEQAFPLRVLMSKCPSA